MNVRDATLEDEPWVLETLEQLGLEDPGFRTYRYVVVTDDDGQRVGLGRLTDREGDAVELTHLGAVGDQEALAVAYAAKRLVERAREEGYETVLVAAESERPFDPVGFEPADAEHEDVVDHDPSETVLRWVPPSEREDDGTESSDDHEADSDETTDATTTKYRTTSERDTNTTAAARERESNASAAPVDTSADTGTDPDGAESTDEGTPTYKYDTSANPGEGVATDDATTDETAADERDQTSRDDSTAEAARKQGLDPDRVNAKYDTDRDEDSKRTKYDA